MTTIAWKDGWMAADSQMNRFDTIVDYRSKIVRRADGAVCAACGKSDLATGFRDWFVNGDRGSLPPSLGKGDESAQAIIITPDGRIREYGPDGVLEFSRSYGALGSGSELALGAMAAGASAHDAVLIACDYDVYSGLPVQAYRVGSDEGMITDRS